MNINEEYKLKLRSKIIENLEDVAKDFIIDIRNQVSSTNDIAKDIGRKGDIKPRVIIARQQTKGRGRMGRNFYSPKDTGIYLSVLFKPTLSLEESLLITTNAAVAVAFAIEDLTGHRTEIKWVNDILIQGKKVCGILTEGAISPQLHSFKYAVVGIGINAFTQTFPEDIIDKAGSVFSKDKEISMDITSILIANILNNLTKTLNLIGDKEILQEYIDRSYLIGKDILVMKGKDLKESNALEAKATGIDHMGRLVVHYNNGKKENLSSGQVKIRLKEGKYYE